MKTRMARAITIYRWRNLHMTEAFFVFCLVGGPLLAVMLIVIVWELVCSGFFSRRRP